MPVAPSGAHGGLTRSEFLPPYSQNSVRPSHFLMQRKLYRLPPFPSTFPRPTATCDMHRPDRSTEEEEEERGGGESEWVSERSFPALLRSFIHSFLHSFLYQVSFSPFRHALASVLLPAAGFSHPFISRTLRPVRMRDTSRPYLLTLEGLVKLNTLKNTCVRE